MIKREITLQNVENTIKSGDKFNYFHNGITKTGYYDSRSKTFVGTVDGKVTTTINNVDKKYVSNLKKNKSK